MVADLSGENVTLRLGLRIPLRDGTRLAANLYSPSGAAPSGPVIVSMTPYMAARQKNHERAARIAAHGYACLVVDVRGRGNSEGEFRPFIQEADDGHDIVQWAARQDFCDGRVAMYSGSYEGYAQWATAATHPSALQTIIPGMAALPGIDVPMRNNIFGSYWMQWITLVSGRTSQEPIFADLPLWRKIFRRWYASGLPFDRLDEVAGNPSPLFQEWLSHPRQDAYWDAYCPSSEALKAIDIPILSITGSYDVNQPGALHFYREHLRHASPEAGARHYLVIGPWDHGTALAPRAEFAGLCFGDASLVDIQALQCAWFDWILRGGERPAFLEDRVSYYMMGADEWRYAPTLEAVTSTCLDFYLGAAGSFSSEPREAGIDRYSLTPSIGGFAALESEIDPDDHADQRLFEARRGNLLVYRSDPFVADVDIAGFFQLSAWIAIDQPDADFVATIYEECADGKVVRLASDCLRARYRESLRTERLITATAPLRYDFVHFPFIARRLARGSCLRLVIGPLESIFHERNGHTGGVVSAEDIAVARAVRVALHRGEACPSRLTVPLADPGSARCNR